MPFDHPAAARFAPGKLLLFGEYSVLACGTALVATTPERGVWARHDPDQRGGYWVRGAPTELALPKTVIRALGLPEDALDSLSADVTALFDGHAKLGLGSSAASTVALLELLLALTGRVASAHERFALALRAHRDLQAGRGSGADLAASTFGGLIRFALRAPQPPFRALPAAPDAAPTTGHEADIAPLRWPAGLRVEAVWLGAPASSTQLIGRVERALAQDSPGVMQALEALDRLALAALQALERDDASSVVAQAAQADLGLERLGQLTQAPILIPAHVALRAHAARFGLTAKPSGAGGGDLSLLFGTQDASWERALQSLPAGCAHVALRLA